MLQASAKVLLAVSANNEADIVSVENNFIVFLFNIRDGKFGEGQNEIFVSPCEKVRTEYSMSEDSLPEGLPILCILTSGTTSGKSEKSGKLSILKRV